MTTPPTSTPRFIPACAGNTALPRSPTCRRRTVHPRVCGEHRHRPGVDRIHPRFIPACAGNTPSAALSAASSVGSSPRVRGTLVNDHDRPHRDRFIPACAGNTRRQGNGGLFLAVHPRVCGEHNRGHNAEINVVGSSPRVRGTRPADRGGAGGRRFIPACAGNTCPARRPPPKNPVHPRVCGEHSFRNLLIDNSFTTKEHSTSESLHELLKSKGLVQASTLRLARGVQWSEAHELHAVQVCRNATIYATCIEVVAGVVRCCPSNYGVALFDQGLYLAPDHLSGSSRIVADVHAGPDF